MSVQVLDRLIAAERALIDALDGGDAEQIEQGTTGYASALDQVRAVGAWRGEPEVKARVREALALAGAARIRVNLLADMTRQRLNLLSRAAGREPGIGYRRDGRLR